MRTVAFEDIVDATKQLCIEANLVLGQDVLAALRAARESFIRLQVASDNGRLEEAREVTTGEMFDALSGGGARRQTGVVTLQADLLEVETESGRHRASVRFSGLRRNAAGAEPAGFEEIWNLVRPVEGGRGWLLAGIQQMH